MHVLLEELEARTLASATPVLHAANATPATASGLSAFFAQRYQTLIHQNSPAPAPPPVPAALNVYPPEPGDAGTETVATGPLFAPGGPVLQDVNQRQIADCYLLADLASWAAESPAFITSLVTPDTVTGRYIVTFDRGSQITHVHVTADFPSFATQPGGDGAIWAQLIEKAYAYFRTGADTYASLNYGSAAATANDFGVNVGTLPLAGVAPQTITQAITTALANHKLLVADTLGGAPNLVPSHSYAITNLTVDAAGTTWITLQNPWGFDDAQITLSALQSNVFDIDYGM